MGGGGTDLLFGGDGDDVLTGGNGSDMLHGGAIETLFAFESSHALLLRFSEDVSTSLGPDNLILQNLTTGQTVATDAIAVTYDTSTNTATLSFPGLSRGVLPDMGRIILTDGTEGIDTHRRRSPLARPDIGS